MPSTSWTPGRGAAAVLVVRVLDLAIFFAAAREGAVDLTKCFLDGACKRFVKGVRFLEAARIDDAAFRVPEVLEVAEACFFLFLGVFIEGEV